MMIHPTAIVHPKARIAPHVSIGPYVVIGADVEIGEGSQVDAHSVLSGPAVVLGKRNKVGPNVVIESHTTIGDDNVFFQFCSVGAPPQDLKFKGEESRLSIGSGNIFREMVTLNRGTGHGNGITRVGNNNFIMAYVHVAHDCLVGNNVVIANSVGLAGYVSIDDFVVIGGMVGIAQFVRIGAFAYIGGYCRIPRDVPPYMTASPDGVHPILRSINSIGLKRRGVSDEVIRQLKQAFKVLFISDLTLEESIQRVNKEISHVPEVKKLLIFMEQTKQGILGGRRKQYDTKDQDSRHRGGVSRELSH